MGMLQCGGALINPLMGRLCLWLGGRKLALIEKFNERLLAIPRLTKEKIFNKKVGCKRVVLIHVEDEYGHCDSH